MEHAKIDLLVEHNEFVSEAGGLRFKFWAGQIGHSVANGLPLLRHFFERSCIAWPQ